MYSKDHCEAAYALGLNDGFNLKAQMVGARLADVPRESISKGVVDFLRSCLDTLEADVTDVIAQGGIRTDEIAVDIVDEAVDA